MPEAPSYSKKPTRASRGTMLVSGTLIAVLAGAVGMQIMRAQSSKAAVQNDAGESGKVRMDALSKPVSRVNGQSISYEDLASECIQRNGREVLDNVINRTLIQQACSQAGVSVSDAEVNNEIVRISKKFGLPVDQWEKMLESERGLTPIQYRRDVIWPMLALKKLAGQDVQITREKMKEAYYDNYGPRVKARMMVLDNLRRAQDIWEKVRATPAEFENFARDYSVEPNSRALGGTVPPIRRYSGAHEEIRKAAFKMAADAKKETAGEAISGIIQVDMNQYVILKFEGMTDPVPHDEKDVEAQLSEELREREVQKMVAETFDKLKTQARIDNYLTGETSGPVQQTSGTALPGDIEQALQR